MFGNIVWGFGGDLHLPRFPFATREALFLIRGGYAILGFRSAESAEKALKRNGQRIPDHKAGRGRLLLSGLEREAI